MSQHRWRRVEEVLDAALTRPPEEWRDILDRQCGDDAALRAEVEGLLAHHRSAQGFLESPPARLAADIVAEAEVHPDAGRMLGPWRLGREIGRGGMARVHLAERADGQYRHLAAVKLLRPGLDSDFDLERFRAERQILATLDHPNIARILDGGVTPDGLPWLALELVEGVPIDVHCRERALSIRGRLRLFRGVLEAVHHAHQHLVVHRDLKPSNILVTAEGGVKLLDFGVAKILDPGASGGSGRVTATAQRWITPEYAAPEQVSGEPATTLTDVWQLGAVLFELLAGRPPFGERGASPFALEEAVLRTTPPPPSSLADLPRALRADLDAIVLQALRKEPGRRYSSAAGFLEDLVRLEAGRPVRARPEGTGYRLRKFVRRNWVPVAAGLVTAFALVGATIFSTAQMREARRQRDLALQESRRNLALSDVQGLLIGDVRDGDGTLLSRSALLALAERVLEAEHPGDPALRVQVMTDLSSPFSLTGDREYGMRLLGQAGAVARGAGLAPELASVECHRAYHLGFTDRDSARLALEEARAALARAPSHPPEVEVRCLLAEGHVLRMGGDHDSAVAILGRAAGLTGSRTPNLLRLQVFDGLAAALEATGDVREAVAFNLRIARELDSLGYAGTLDVISTLSQAVYGLWLLGELRQADSLIRAELRRAEGDSSAGGTGSFFAHFRAVTQLRLEQLDTAEAWLARVARDTSEAAPVIARTLPATIAELRLAQGRLVDARSELAKLPPSTRLAFGARMLLKASIQRISGDPRGASEALERFLDSAAARPDPLRPVARPLLIAAEWRLADGEPSAADSIARRVIALSDSVGLTRSAWVGRAEMVRARAALAMADTIGARQAAHRALLGLANGYGPGHRRTTGARTFLDSIAR